MQTKDGGAEVRWSVPEALAGERLDRALAVLAHISRGEARRLLEAGGVYLDGKRIRKASAELKAGARVEARLDAAETADRGRALLAERPPRFVHREARLAILDKPPGVPVQATRASVHGTLESWLMEQPGVRYCAFHHRLDRDARGLIAVSLHRSANQALAAAFRDRTARRTYRVLVEGEPAAEAGDWVHRQVKRGGERTALPGAKGPGELMRSRWRCLERRGGRALLEVELETGRTHQIRLQAAAEGLPVVGDKLYGRPAPGGLHLQASGLELPDLRTGEPKRWELELPEGW